jgi:hypothetical protein
LPQSVRIDETGNRYGRLTVIGFGGHDKDGHAKWQCRCDCGSNCNIRGGYLRRGLSSSCGCFHKEQLIQRSTTHGMSKSPTYICWLAMKNRCDNPSQQSYKRYGAIGIKICKRWRSFENFLADMGERLPGTTLDRKNVLGNYEPQNCRWASPGEQANNTRGQLAIMLIENLMEGTMTRQEVIESWSPAQAWEKGNTRLEDA